MSSGPVSTTSPTQTAEDRFAVATQWQLTWWRFRKHKLAVASGIIVIAFYVVVLLADFLAYAVPHAHRAGDGGCNGRGAGGGVGDVSRSLR